MSENFVDKLLESIRHSGKTGVDIDNNPDYFNNFNQNPDSVGQEQFYDITAAAGSFFDFGFHGSNNDKVIFGKNNQGNEFGFTEEQIKALGQW